MEGLEGLREMMVVSLRRAAFLLAAEQEGAAFSLASAPGRLLLAWFVFAQCVFCITLPHLSGLKEHSIPGHRGNIDLRKGQRPQ